MPGRLTARPARRPTTRPAALAVVASALLAAPVLGPSGALAPADAAARVTVANPDGDAVVDATYATTLTVSGRGFQSLQGGHGGIYVFFGTVEDGWRPSQGGRTGVDYLYVPDSESASNAGFQRYVAFPGSDTAASANGGTLAADGTWSASIVVPGATFQAVDRSGSTRTVDCRESTCGIITIGAHGVTNASNETFTPVRVADLHDAEQPAPDTTPSAGAVPGADAGSGAAAPPGTAPAAAGPAVLEVDRSGAVAGRVLPFTGSGLPAGRQVSVTFDDGAAAAGPFQVGADGTLAGVVTLPEDTEAGTHELRLFGLEEEVAVSFAVRAADDAAAADLRQVAASEAGTAPDRWALAFVVVAAAALLGALVRLVLLRRRGARA